MKKMSTLTMLAVAALVAAAGVILAVRSSFAQTYTEKLANCLIEAQDALAECRASNDHDSFVRWSIHETRCWVAFGVNTAACVPKELFPSG